MAKRITLTLLLALFATSAVVLVVSGMTTYRRREENQRQLGREHALLGAKMAEYLLEKTVATGIFSVRDLFDESLEPIPGTHPPQYHSKFDRYLDRNLAPIQDAFLGPDAIYYVYTVTYGGYVPVHTKPEASKTRPDAALYSSVEGEDGLHLFRDPDGATYYEFSYPIQIQGRPWGEFRVGIPIALVQAAVWSDLALSGASIGTLTLLVAFLCFLLVRMNVKPLSRLVAAAEAISAGDLTYQLELSSRDEVGQVAAAFARMVETMRATTRGLHESTLSLNDVVNQLSASAVEQSQAVSRQATALQETQVTAQEIKQTSLLAAQKAEAVLQGTTRADEVTRSGEAAIEQSVSGLIEIRSQVESVSQRIKELAGSTRQIRTITDSVKDLADQSNMLALNAAIEAVRSGEHGKGFSVVAREVRSLADQSVQSTNRVREILEDIAEAISVTVSISEQGTEKIEGGLAQIKASGENLQLLSNIVKENVSAVRQIAAAVSQQNAGIGQIFQAVTDQNRMMEETVKHLQVTNAMVDLLKGVSDRVSKVVATYRV